jgi:cell wall-associated NlpC family hydrolase
LGLGTLLLWSGIRGKKITQALRDVISGKSPTKAGNNPITGSAGATGEEATGSASGSAIASDAIRYQGVPYKWGGYLPSGWDCSGFVNYVLGHDLGMSLPGGAVYTGTSHGPVVGQYQAWNAAVHVPLSQVQAGDIILYTVVHMGIAVSNTEFISAEDPADGTAIAPISAGPGPSNAIRIL